MPAQQVQGERQGAAGGLVAGDQEDDGLVAHVVIGESNAGLRVSGGEKAAEQVRSLGAACSAVGDERVSEVPDHLRVASAWRLAGEGHQCGERRGDSERRFRC